MDANVKINAVVLAAMVYAVLSLAGGFEIARAETRVSGSVRDAAGNSVAHAYVEAIPVVAKNTGGVVGNLPNPWVAADTQGTFSLSLAPGRYRIRAKDEVDGYPDPSFWVNLDPKAKFPEITVGDKEIRDVDVVLGKQGGILSGKARDAQTGKSLAGVKIRIQDAKNANAYVEVFTDENGYFQYAVASKPLLISGVRPGYKAIALASGAEITLLPGEHREFPLEMKH